MAAPPTPPAPDHDLVVVGLGSGGLAAIEFAAGLGLRVAAVERGRPGGDCLWTGCVPSKAIIASARAAHVMRTADRLGIHAVEPTIDLATVWRRARAVQAEIAITDDDPRRFADLGVEVISGSAQLTSPTEVEVTIAGGAKRVLTTRFVLLCTGSHPHVPVIEGLSPSRCLTSENVFAIDAPPSSLAIIGGGAMGTEMAQALARLGVHVTVFEKLPTLLATEEPRLVRRLMKVLANEGVTLHCDADVRSVEHCPDGTHVVHALAGPSGGAVEVTVGGVLVAAGRTPNMLGLGLDEIGITTGPAGIPVDDRGRTNVRSVYAAGDVTGRRRLANASAFEAVQAVRDMFFPGRGNAERSIPWCTFTDPELARIGLTAAEAEEEYGSETDVWQRELTRNDRARTEARPEGELVVVTAKGKIVGAHVLAPCAGEMVHELAMAVRDELRIDELAGLVHAYPTFSSAIGQLATEAAYERAHRLKWMVKRK
jgi:pyruvate/2-oxoglutarate dehydrogenase complex dihydrolipoamide dehydrogenase (E3) component